LEPFLALEFNRIRSLKKQSEKIPVYVLFIAAVFAFVVCIQVKGREMVEDMPNIGVVIIHEHEELEN
jgi:hypothetical protein